MNFLVRICVLVAEELEAIKYECSNDRFFCVKRLDSLPGYLLFGEMGWIIECLRVIQLGHSVRI